MTKIAIYDQTGAQQGHLEMDLALEQKKVNTKVFAHAIRSLIQNWRQGTVGCKTRGEVSFSNRKPWKQKGTGRARAGSLRSPLWRSGGVIFGPQPRTRKTSINQKQKRIALNNLLFAALEAQNIICLDFNVISKPNTKQAFGALKSAGLEHKKVVLFLSFNDFINNASFRNINDINIVYYDQPNAYDLSDCQNWILLKKDVDLFKEMVSKWN